MVDKILITARSFRKTPGLHQQILIDAGYEIIHSPQDRPLAAAELAAVIGDVTGAILGLDAVTDEVFTQAGKLKVISRYGIGVDKVDLEAATRHGVVVTNTPGANSIAVAELTLALILALARRIPYHDRVVKSSAWNRVSGIELEGLTLGLIGMGRIGREVAKRATGFGMRIIYYDPLLPPDQLISSLGVASESLDSLLSQSDIISLHLPLMEDTHNLLNAERLQQMKHSALLINTARGGLIDETALYEALVTGKLAGAACDVFAQEPPSDHPLLHLDNFIATPHVGSDTLQTALRMGLMASQNALAVLHGDRPVDVVNPEVYVRDLR